MTDEKKKQEQQQRLSQQLRTNLIRRKEQARGRREQETPFNHDGIQNRNKTG